MYHVVIRTREEPPHPTTACSEVTLCAALARLENPAPITLVSCSPAVLRRGRAYPCSWPEDGGFPDVLLSHPQVFWAACNRHPLEDSLARRLYALASRGRRALAQRISTNQWHQLNLSSAAWFDAVLTLDRKTNRRWQQVAGAVVTELGRGKDGQDPGPTLDDLLTRMCVLQCPQAAWAVLLNRLKHHGGSGQPDSLYRQVRAGLFVRNQPAAFVDERIEQDSRVLTWPRPTLFRDHKRWSRSPSWGEEIDTLDLDQQVVLLTLLPDWSGDFAELLETAACLVSV